MQELEEVEGSVEAVERVLVEPAQVPVKTQKQPAMDHGRKVEIGSAEKGGETRLRQHGQREFRTDFLQSAVQGIGK